MTVHMSTDAIHMDAMHPLRFRLFDPLRDEWATPHPAAQPMTKDSSRAVLFDSEPTAVMRSRQLIGPDRPWLIMQPVCPVCGTAG